MKYLLFLLLFPTTIAFAGNDKNEDKEPIFNFKNTVDVKYSSVKNQYITGTCWSYATVSFLEAEIIREKDEVIDLSEMFFVNHAYQLKADYYVRLHGNSVFSQGGQAHDVTHLIEKYGMVPQECYPGKTYDLPYHDHRELSAMLTGMVKAALASKGNGLTDKWKESVQNVTNTYLGNIPDKFDYKGKEYTPESFRDLYKINENNYIEITSFSHQPFYSFFDLEIPDNWMHRDYFNLPLDKMMEIFDNALKNGYTICWDGDVSSEFFRHKEGYAVYHKLEPMQKPEDIDLNDEEDEVTQEIRQKYFDRIITTDDHLMHIVGIATDQNGRKYYQTKNSWGDNSNQYGGILYMSEAFVRMNTIAAMINKKALNEDLRNKLK